jgi:glycosyltransferase involved in cell wall biosynthesis/drug/metabolite transporter (DMT)-like permease
MAGGVAVMAWAICVAVAGALFFALAAALQQHEASTAPATGVPGWRLLAHLVQRPRWVCGMVAMLLGGGLHLLALRSGPLVLVQPLGVTAVLFALPLAAALRGYRVRAWEIGAAALVVVGLGGLLLAVPEQPPPSLDATDAMVLVALATITSAVLAGLARGQGPVRALQLALAAGILFGTTSTLIWALLAELGNGGLTAAAAVGALSVVPLAVAGLVLTQHAYRAGSTAVVLATTTVTDPVTAVAGGVLVLGEVLPADMTSLVILASAGILIISGISYLAGSPAHRSSAHALTAHRKGSPEMPTDPESSTAHTVGQRILIGTDTYYPDVNGASYFTQRLAAGLAGRDHDVHVVCPAYPDQPMVGERDDVTIHRIPSMPILLHPTFRIPAPLMSGIHVRRIVGALRPDVIHAQGHFLVGRALIHHASQAGIPLVATNHFMPENLLGYSHIPAWLHRGACALAWRDFARVFRRVAHITTPTPIAAQLIRTKGVGREVQAISCGIDLARFHPRPAADRPAALRDIPDRPSVLFVGRLDEEKHLPELIDALSLVRNTTSTDAQLWLVGTGNQRAALQQRSQQRGVAEQVHFLGFVPDEELPAVYAAADVFCIPGVAELQSLATLEAMASGKPVVAADAMALPHLVHPGINGYLYRPGDVDQLAHHLSTLLGSWALRETMGQASLRAVAEHDIHVSLARFEALYIQAHGRQQPTAPPAHPAPASLG